MRETQKLQRRRCTGTALPAALTECNKEHWIAHSNPCINAHDEARQMRQLLVLNCSKSVQLSLSNCPFI